MNWLTFQFELSRAGGGHNLRTMEGLRGFAVLLVFLVHYVSAIEPWLAAGSPLATFAGALHVVGNSGVDLFFVLSGYLIYGSLIGRRQPTGRFLLRRVRRIYPTFSAVFVLYVALCYLLPAENRIPPGTRAGALYLAQNFLLLSSLGHAPPLITVAWSLAYEMLYYLVIPVIIAVFGLRARSGPWRMAFFALLLPLAAGALQLCGGPLRLLMFAAGIFLHEALALQPMPVARPAPVVALLGVAIGMAGMLGPAALALKLAALGTGFFLLCLCCFSQPQTWLARGFGWTPLRWLGNMSYSYYLLHGLALKAAFLALGPASAQGALFFCALLPLMLLATLLPSVLLYLAVERPLSLTAPAATHNKVRAQSR